MGTVNRGERGVGTAALGAAHRHREEASRREEVLFEIDVGAWVSCDGAHHRNTHVSEPREVACFSRDGDRNVKFGDRGELRTFVEPPMNSNLEDGFDTFVPKSTNGAPVETVLEALQAGGFSISEQADVVTYRNNLNKIGGSPYNTRDEWEMDSVIIGTTVYLDVRHTGDAPNEMHKRFIYSGYRFEALCTGTEDEPVNANSEFCSIARLRIANHRILISSEIDCTAGDPANTHSPIRDYIELKTMRVLQSGRDWENLYKHRFPKYWLQSYLAGVRRIALGFRSDSKLVEIRRFETGKLHREACQYFEQMRSTSQNWSPFVCINFIDYVLATIRRACSQKSGSTVRIRFRPRQRKIEGFVVASQDEGLGARVRQVYSA